MSQADMLMYGLHSLGIDKTQERNTGLQEAHEACGEDFNKMSEKGELRRRMTVEECIKDLCK